MGQADDVSDSRRPYEIAMFSGGTGSNRLTRALLREWGDQVHLRILINAYDDGKSTGKIRRDFEVLGPSDIGKNLIAALDPFHPATPPLSEFLEHSLPKAVPDGELGGLDSRVRLVAQNRPGPDPLGDAFKALPEKIRAIVAGYFADFVRLTDTWSARHGGAVYDYRDYRMRNLLVVGAVERHGGDYRKGLDALGRDLGARAEILLNDDRDIHLAALTVDGRLLADEAAIVDGELDQDIGEVFLLRERLSASDQKDCLALSPEARETFMRERAEPVSLDSVACDALRRADAIVFAPTTLESSLVPTLLSQGCFRALLEARGPRIFVANLVRERGIRSLADQLRYMEQLMQRELGTDYFLHDVLDCVVANTGFRKTGPLGGTRRIPVDRHDIESLGVELFEDDFEDPQKAGYHDGGKLASWLMNYLNFTSRRTNRIEDPSAAPIATPTQNRLARLLSDPLNHHREVARVRRIARDVVTEVRSLPSNTSKNANVSQIRVVIAANGRGSRMRGELPKVLHPIAGQPALQRLVERASAIDPECIVVTNHENDRAIAAALRQWAPQASTLVTAPQGSGAAVLAALERLPTKATEVVIIWGDAPNVQRETMQGLLEVQQALPDRLASIATCWEPNPYAGIERDADGRVSGFFQTKVNPATRREVGEHDASLFVVNREGAIAALRRQLQRLIGSAGNARTTKATPEINRLPEGVELDLLQALHHAAHEGATLQAFALADPRETQGFNTVEEAEQVSRWALELEGKLEGDASAATLSNTGDAAVKPSASGSREVTLDAMQARLRVALRQAYRGFAVDVDGNLIDARERLTAVGFQRLVDLARRGIPIGLITGRRLDSLERLLLNPIIEALEPNERRVLSQFYVYPFNGAAGFRLDNPKSRFYDHRLPRYLSSAAMRCLRQGLLSANDSYDITDYKITIWPGEARLQSQMVLAINELLTRQRIPVQAQVSGSPTFNGAIVMTSIEHGSRAGKRVALHDFAARSGVPIEAMAKVGDQAGPFGVDHELLEGMGSFSTETCDPACEHQVSLPWVTGKQHLEAFDWLIERLEFVAGVPDATTNVPSIAQIKV